MSRKKRKLEFIREKNKYRLGGLGRFYTKVSAEIFKDKEFFEDLIKLNLQTVSNKFKLSLEIVGADVGQENDDFLKDLQTVVVTFKRLY